MLTAISFALLAGVLVGLSRQLNGRLSLSTTPLISSFWNHAIGFALLGGADEGAVFHAGDVGGVGKYEERVGALGGIEADESSSGFGLSAQAVIFLLGAIAPVNGVGFAKRGDFFDPLQ